MSQHTEITAELKARVGAEYREMPGLQLTIAQGARLWSTDRATVQAVFDAMVAARVLCQQGAAYVRRDSGMATA